MRWNAEQPKKSSNVLGDDTTAGHRHLQSAQMVWLADRTSNSSFRGAISDTHCAAKHLTPPKFQFQSLPRVLTA
jgi:hypothetical protein